METPNQKITRKTHVQMGGYLPNEDEKLDSLRPGSREMERGRWEGQNFQPLKEVQRLEEEETLSVCIPVFEITEQK